MGCYARRASSRTWLICGRDPLVPELLGIRRVASQSSLARFFAGFDSAAVHLRCFRGLWQWGMMRLPSRKEGYTLDLDSTRLLHEDGHQHGVAVGYTRQGLKPCLHPLVAVWAEVRLVAQLWLRAGNTACANNVAAFFLDLWENLPSHLGLRAVRADAGFCTPELLAVWEQLGLPYVVVAQLCEPIKKSAPPGAGVGGDRGGRHGGGGDRISSGALAPCTAVGAHPPPRGGARRPWRQTAARRAGLPVPGAGHQPAREPAATGRVALL